MCVCVLMFAVLPCARVWPLPCPTISLSLWHVYACAAADAACAMRCCGTVRSKSPPSSKAAGGQQAPLAVDETVILLLLSL